MPKDVTKCPYRTAVPISQIEMSNIEERFDFQIGEDGKIERVSLGKFDLVAEVNSHAGEVGLINVLRLAEARGISPDVFAKTEPGLMADPVEIDTLDDLLNAKADTEAKLGAVAAQFGLTVDQLVAAIKAGDQSVFVPKEEEPKKDGE